MSAQNLSDWLRGKRVPLTEETMLRHGFGEKLYDRCLTVEQLMALIQTYRKILNVYGVTFIEKAVEERKMKTRLVAENPKLAWVRILSESTSADCEQKREHE